ncbi:ATP-binding cassette sub-family B member 6, mitochondrial [Trichoplax sp. H2]|nr:ATP-binding cassette sub-family B member 6, mitochondrial [Trichoplax sp. H2]|eukprot:RDD46710.1 ATP-binding cassette sub-family B member 6, mitochondrial [Trichoplax sp. H2]
MSTTQLNKTYPFCTGYNGLSLTISLKELLTLCYYQTFTAAGLLLLSALIVLIQSYFSACWPNRTNQQQRQQIKAIRLCNQIFLAIGILILLTWFVSTILSIFTDDRQLPADYVAVNVACTSLGWLIIWQAYRRARPRMHHCLQVLPFLIFVIAVLTVDTCYFTLNDISEWWWQFNSEGKVALAICFAIRYIATLLALLPLIYHSILLFRQRKSFDYNSINLQDQNYPLLHEELETNLQQESLNHRIQNVLKFWYPRLFSSYVYIMMCIILVLLERAINLLAMIYVKLIVDSVIDSSKAQILIKYMAILATCKFLLNGSDGRVGLITNIRILCWTKLRHSVLMSTQVQIFSCVQQQSYYWFINLSNRELASKAADIIYGLNSIFDVLEVGNIYYSKQYQETVKHNHQQKLIAIHLMTNYETVQLNCSEDSEIKRLHHAIAENQASSWRMTFTAFWTHSIQSLLAVLGFFCGGIATIKLILLTQLTVGDLVLFIIYLEVIYSCVRTLISNSSYGQIQDINRLFTILQDLLKDNNYKELPDLEAHQDGIKMENVSSRPNRKYPAIENVSLQVLYQQTLALVGSPTSGKDAILKLIYGWHPLHQGKITVLGRNIQLVNWKSLRRNIGYIPKEPKLIQGTIKHNVSYGCSNKSEREIIRACELVGIHEKLISLPEGYDTLIGIDELRFRVEDRVKIAIARVILKDPEIVLIEDLSETILNLDDKSWDTIIQPLCTLFNERTVVISTNRLEFIQKCDNIVVIKGGKTIDEGRHKYLRATNLYYRSLVR